MFFETIKIYKGRICNINYHNKRLNNTIKSIFNVSSNIDISSYISLSMDFDTIKCRVLYQKEINSISYSKYIKKKAQSFKIINDNNITYEYKFNNRKHINKLFFLRDNHDEIIIIKNGFITDTSIANIAILYKDIWLTPKLPLFNGIIRPKLGSSFFLKEENITVEMLKSCKCIAIMNAMIGFEIINEFKIKGF
jgi:4-amino-4-deoxychorismate lyase